MTAEAKAMYSMRCDYQNGCSSELEGDDGEGAWLYDSADQARVAAYDYDWVTDGIRDYCDHHRDELPEDDQIMPHRPIPQGEGLFPDHANGSTT